MTGPVISITRSESCCVAVILLLREGMPTWPMPGHPMGHQTATLADLPPHRPSEASQVAECMRIHGYSLSVPRVDVQACHNVSRPCPSWCTRPCLCHSVSAWLKHVCMQRATPQLSESEMGFDFHNPVASMPINTHMLTEQECSVKANRRIALCRSANKHKELYKVVYLHAYCRVAIWKIVLNVGPVSP